MFNLAILFLIWADLILSDSVVTNNNSSSVNLLQIIVVLFFYVTTVSFYFEGTDYWLSECCISCLSLDCLAKLEQN